jgi:hypothetical protein
MEKIKDVYQNIVLMPVKMACHVIFSSHLGCVKSALDLFKLRFMDYFKE